MGIDERLWAEDHNRFNEYLLQVEMNLLQKNARSIIISLEKIQAELILADENGHSRGL